MTHLAIALGLAGALAASPPRDDGAVAPPPIELRDGDRVVLVGDALIERMQDHGFLEAILTAAHPDKAITFRNLGWSGDTVFGEARAGFGTPEDGFNELVAQVKAAAPTILIVGYGANESWAGEAGLSRFRDGYNRLLDALGATGAREVVLLSPIVQAGPADDPRLAAHNGDVARYAAEVARIAARGHRFVDLVATTGTIAGARPGAGPHFYDRDGVHLEAAGYEWIVPTLLRPFSGAETPFPTAELIVGDSVATRAEGCTVLDPEATPGGLRFRLALAQLPRLSLGQRGGGTWGRITVEGLPEGAYRVTRDGRQPERDGQRTAPVPGTFVPDLAADLEQFEALRRAIVAKDRLYFHRYRPQNSTYLFGFRKHEQGNNAVEVEQFERLVAEAEAEIARLKVPQPRVYELERIAEEDADR